MRPSPVDPFPLVVLFALCAFVFGCNKEFNGRDGTQTLYYPGSMTLMQTAVYKDGKKNGPLVQYQRDGRVKARQYFVNDEPQDSAVFYHENGQLSNIQIIKNKKREGCWKKFNRNGKVYSEINFKNNLLDGPSIVYTYNSGRVKERYNYVEGRKHGKQEVFYNNGRPKYVAFFWEGRPCAGTREWAEDGVELPAGFKITVAEKNTVMLDGKLRFFLTLSGTPTKTDRMYEVVEEGEGHSIKSGLVIPGGEGKFLLEYVVPQGGFVMRDVKISALRETGMGNTVVETTTLTASANNF